LTLPVTLSEPATGLVTVDYVVTPGSATAGTKPGPGIDYKPKTGTISFKVNLQGVTPIMKQVAVPVFGDLDDEGDETFTVTLSNPTGGYSIGRSTGLGTILNDDGGSGNTAGVGDSSIVVQESGKESLKVPVSLSSAAATDISMDITITPGSATYSKKAEEGGDFGGAKLTKTILFKAGSTLKFVVAPVWPDLVAEADGQFTVEITNVTGGSVTVIRDTGTGTLLKRL
jgi:hypothetical protein